MTDKPVNYVDLATAFRMLKPSNEEARKKIAALLDFEQAVELGARHLIDGDSIDDSPPITDELGDDNGGSEPPPGEPEIEKQIILTELDKKPIEMKMPVWLADVGELPTKKAPPPKRAPSTLFLHKWIRSTLIDTLSTPVLEGEADVAQIVEILSRQETPLEIPRLPVPTMRRGVQVLVDRSNALIPFKEDQQQLVRELGRLTAGQFFEVMEFSGSPRRGVRILYSRRAESSNGSYVPPPADTPVLVLSDLGMTLPQYDLPPVPISEWLSFSRQVRAAGCIPVAFVPYAFHRWPQALKGAMTVYYWGHNYLQFGGTLQLELPSATAAQLEEAADDVTRLAGWNPYAVELAKLVSLAWRVERSLLRATRLHLLPDADSGVEADLWFSALVETRSSEAITLRSDVVAYLHQVLKEADKPDRVQESWNFLDRYRQESGASNLLRQLEKINYLALRDGRDALDKIERILGEMLLTLRKREGQQSLAIWSIEAMNTVPELVRERDASKVLQWQAYKYLGISEIPNIGLPGDPTAINLMVADSLTLEETTTIGIRAVGKYLQFSEPPESGSEKLHDVPVGAIRALVITWPDDADLGSQTVKLTPDQPLDPVPIREGTAIIRYLDGRGYRLELQALAERGSIINPYIAGSPVTGTEMFFGRKDVFEYVRQTLTGEHRDQVIVLHGQRRTGKTSVLYQMHRHLSERYLCIFVDLQSLALESMDGFLWELANRIWRSLKKDYEIELPLLRQREFSADARGQFENFLNDLWSTIGDRHVLLMMDEVERLQAKVRAGDLESDVYEYLRHLMQHYRRLSFLFSIGAGLEEMEKDYNLLFNVVIHKKISFLEADVATSLITEPVEGYYQVAPSAIEHISDITSGHPYFIQLICHSIFNRWQKEGQEIVSVADVDATLEEVMDRGLAVLTYVWKESDAAEKAVLAGMASAIDDSNQSVSLDIIIGSWSAQKAKIPKGQAVKAIESLIAREVITGDNKYAFTVTLQQMWVKRHRRIEWVKEEIFDDRGDLQNDKRKTSTDFTPRSEKSANPFTYGDPITDPERFFGRQREVEQVFSRLLNPEAESSSLVGSRRIGKTSLLNYLAHPLVHRKYGLDLDRFNFVYINLGLLDSDMTPSILWAHLFEEMAGQCKDNEVKNRLNELRSSAAVENINNFVLVDVFEFIDERDQHIVLLLDEFEHVTKNVNFSAAFFYGLRFLATRHNLSLVTSSQQELIDLTHSETIRSSPFFNIFANINLGLLGEEEAQELIVRSLANSSKTFTVPEVEAVLRIAGPYPFFLQIACYFLFQAYREGINPEERLIFVEKNLSTSAALHFKYFWNDSDKDEQIVLLILALTAQQSLPGKHSCSKDDLDALYSRAGKTVDRLVKRALVTKELSEYALFGTAFRAWIVNALADSASDEFNYKTLLNFSRQFLSRLRTRNKKSILLNLHMEEEYRNLIEIWINNTSNPEKVVDLLKNALS